MNVCCICQADGVMEALGSWYCVDHLEDGMVQVTRFVAYIRGWDLDDSEAAITDWLES